jgi:hypothetical protein
MLFLLNDTVFNLDAVALAPPVSATRFEKLSLRFVGQLGAEMFAKDPLLHLTSPERAARLAALIVAKAPEVNAALFVAMARDCPVDQVAVRYAQISFEVMGLLYSRQQDGMRNHLEADRQVWRRLAA